MEEILEKLKQLSAEISLPPAQWLDKFNAGMVERGFAPVRPEHYWAALGEVISAKIDLIIYDAERRMKNKEVSDAQGIHDSGGTE